MPRSVPEIVSLLITRIDQLFSSDLVAENDFLREENRILRGKIQGRIRLTEEERCTLVKYGMRIKDRLPDVISIVRPETLLAWNRRMKKRKWDFSDRPRKPGRPRKGAEVEALVVRLARENGWGYLRIAGEMAKLGHGVSKSYVHDVLKKHDLPPSPERNGLSWKTFIQSHLSTTWATDFFTEEVWTPRGLVTFYVLFFIHLGSRRVHIAGATPHPCAQWTRQQAKNLTMWLEDEGLECRHLIHDRDTLFLPFDDVLATEAIEIVRTPPRTPRCNAYAERFVREARETLDCLIILGESHLRHALRQIVEHHNAERPHQGINNRIPGGYDYPKAAACARGQPALDQIRKRERLGGLLNHYSLEDAA